MNLLVLLAQRFTVESCSEFKIFPASAKIRESFVSALEMESVLLLHLFLGLLERCQTGFERLDGLKIRVLCFVELCDLRFKRRGFVTVSINTLFTHGKAFVRLRSYFLFPEADCCGNPGEPSACKVPYDVASFRSEDQFSRSEGDTSFIDISGEELSCIALF